MTTTETEAKIEGLKIEAAKPEKKKAVITIGQIWNAQPWLDIMMEVRMRTKYSNRLAKLDRKFESKIGTLKESRDALGKKYGTVLPNGNVIVERPTDPEPGKELSDKDKEKLCKFEAWEEEWKELWEDVKDDDAEWKAKTIFLPDDLDVSGRVLKHLYPFVDIEDED